MHCLRRYIRIRVVAAEPMRVIMRMANVGVVISNVVFLNPLTAELEIAYQDFLKAERMLSSGGNRVEYEIIHKDGWFWVLKRILRRPVFVTGLVLFLLFALLIPSRILFIHVEGNKALTDKQILSQAQQYGIRFGSRKRDVRSEQVKNALLGAIPELQWVGINTSGCVATIHVRERSVAKSPVSEHDTISSLVASHSGVVNQIVVLKGTAQCSIGQQVDVGDLLISGYTDSGLKVSAEHADGEVYAYTLREQTVIAPKILMHKVKVKEKHTCIFLRIGKKLLKIWNDSGIHGVTCDKMYDEYILTLPGGFQLPVGMILQTCCVCEYSESFAESSADYEWIRVFSEKYLQGKMVAGQICSSRETITEEEDYYLFMGSYACNEMIGKVRYEEILNNHAEDN